MAEEEEEEAEAWVCNACTFQNQGSCRDCLMCGTVRPRFPWRLQQYRTSLSICNLPSLLRNMLSCALTGAFALVGAFTGAIVGGLACRAAQNGVLRGAGLGAVAGAVLSVEVLEASRAYWHSEHLGASSIPSLSDFVEDLISGRFVQDFLVPAVSSAQRWQLNVTELSYEELYDMFMSSEGGMKGVSEELLRGLPQHVITQTNRRDACGDVLCCAICLQELEQGDIARTLPGCKHTFHLQCVDRWLAKHVICPVCRQYL